MFSNKNMSTLSSPIISSWKVTNTLLNFDYFCYERCQCTHNIFGLNSHIYCATPHYMTTCLNVNNWLYFMVWWWPIKFIFWRLHWKIYAYIFMLTQVWLTWKLTLDVQGPSYLYLTSSVSWLLMLWLITSPELQQWYWLYKIIMSLSYLGKDFNYLCHINLEEWHKM